MSYAKSFDFLFNQMRNGSFGSLAGGSITFYYAGPTSTKKTVWLDRDMTTPASNPYTLTADGTAELFGDGLYYIVIKDSTGTTVYDYDNVEAKAAVDPSVTANMDVIFVDAADDPVTLTVPNQDDTLVVRTDNSSNIVQIVPPTGYTFAGTNTTLYLTLQNEAVQLRRSGLVYYIARGIDVLQIIPSSYTSGTLAESYVIECEVSLGSATFSWPAGTIEVVAIKTDNSANVVTLEPPAGYTFFTGINATLTVQGEATRFVLVGTVYYQVA